MEQGANLPLRSLASTDRSQIIFRNLSSRHVQIIWLNYEGEEESYFVLPPKVSRPIYSFVTHPWICRDHLRNFIVAMDVFMFFRQVDQSAAPQPPRLLTSTTRVFYPAIQNEYEVHVVVIKDRMHSLRELCFRKMCDLKFTSEHLNDIPRFIVAEFEVFRTGQPLRLAVQE